MKESDVSGMKIPAQPISYGDAKHFLRYQESISYMYMYLYMPVVTYEKFVKIVFFKNCCISWDFKVKAWHNN